MLNAFTKGKNENMVKRSVKCHIPFARFATSNIAPGTTKEMSDRVTPYIKYNTSLKCGIH